MCGIVCYFGGAGNNLTRVLTAMSAIIYRAPDSTGIGLFGDDHEPIRLRKSTGSVVQLLDALRTEAVYPESEKIWLHLFTPESGDRGLTRAQRELLKFEGLDEPALETAAPACDFDALVELGDDQPARLAPGCVGQALFRAEHRIRSRQELASLIDLLINSHDLSPLVIQSFIRQALSQTFQRLNTNGYLKASLDEILVAFDELFETVRSDHRSRGASKPSRKRRKLWRCLQETVIQIPSDYNRCGVCCLFRLLDASLLSRMAEEASIAEDLEQVLDMMWSPSQRPFPVNWRALYAVEKGLNVYGWAGAAALAYLQREIFFPAVEAQTDVHDLMTDSSIVPGYTDPNLLRYLAAPIMAHGRWAMQSAVTRANAHPFTDARRRRALALNGQFDSRVEARLRAFLETVGGFRLRTTNSSEYAVLLWGHFYDQLKAEQRHCAVVRGQVDNQMTDISISNQSIDYNVYHRVRDRGPAELDRMAFVAAAEQIVQNGGQIAASGISLNSPQRLYVASHNRPVFIVRRPENDDFMVVSDINAALGLFPQVLVARTVNELEKLKKRHSAITSKKAGEGADRRLARGESDALAKRDRLLERFTVQVYPLDGERIFALIETVMEQGRVHRKVAITDFDGNALPDIEPFETRLNPEAIRKDVDRSFFETHLREVPERFRYILNVYHPDTPELNPAIDLKTRAIRRRFGRRLSGLRRLILVGTGSTLHIAMIARRLLSDLMPEITVETMRPFDIRDPKRRFLPQQDLILMLSWSSTTAEMVQLAQQLLEQRTLMIGVTEKCYADMALAARKSAGVMPIFSGEEVTIAGVKSCLCLLLCLELLGAWLCAEKEKGERLEPFYQRLTDLPQRIEQVNHDAGLLTFSRKIAAAMAPSSALIVVSAPEGEGTGAEIALKLEEAGWYAVSKWLPYDEILNADLGQWSPGRFVLVHATRRTHIDDALAAARKLAENGVPFAVAACPNRHQEQLSQLCGGHYLVLPWTDDNSQPYIDLAFYYRLALDFAFACGHGEGVGPRNRAKSTTVTRSRNPQSLSPASELKRMAAATPEEGAEDPMDLQATPDQWQNASIEPASRARIEELLDLAGRLRQYDPLAALGVTAMEKVRDLGRLLFDSRSAINEIAIAPLDVDARGAAQDAAVVWRRLLNLRISVSPLAQWPRRASEDTLVLMAASDCKSLADRAQPLPQGANVGWIGPEPPLWLRPEMTTAGRFILQCEDKQCSPAHIFAGLHLLLARAWSAYKPQKASVMQRHIVGASQALQAVMQAPRLLEELRETALVNTRYRTAFFISPFASSGRVWEKQFESGGGPMMVHHIPSHASHGPIVTIDNRLEAKYAALDKRGQMVLDYGETRVARWEKLYLGGRDVDVFSANPPKESEPRPLAPFESGGRWFLPELRPGYDTRHDNLIFLDMTNERDLPVMLDELSVLGSRAARLVVITQPKRIKEIGENTLFRFPISGLIKLPSLHDAPIPDLYLPYVLNALAIAAAAVWPDTGPKSGP